MADASKQLEISGGKILTDFKNVFCFMRRRRTVAFAYGFVFVFIAMSVFMAFNPYYSNSSSSSSSYPWFSSIFSNSENTPGDNGSHFSSSSSLYSYFFPNSTSPESHPPRNMTTDRTPDETGGKTHVKNQAYSPAPAPAVREKVGNLTDSGVVKQSKIQPETSESPNSSTRKVDILNENTTDSPPKPPSAGAEGNIDLKSNYTAALLKKETESTTKFKIETLLKCDMFDGNWVNDESYPLYKPGSCSLIDDQFNCVANGRPDGDYMRMKWKPKACSLPRLNAKHMLKLLKGKRLVYVGDSLNRNMWESMICILKSSAKNQNNVYEASGRHQFRAEASYSFIFKVR